MVMNEKAILLIDEILDHEEKLENSVFKYYATEEYSLKEGFEKIANSLARGEVDVQARKQRALEHDERFGSTVCASHLIERGFVNGHENYEYEWYLHIDYDQKKEEYLELFINRVLIATVSLALMIKDYAERAQEEELLTVDPVELVAGMDNEEYRELLGQILGDSDQRIQGIFNKEESPINGVLSHQYVSELYGGVSGKELVQYALKTSVASDDYALIALDQKIDGVMKTLANKNQEKEMNILIGLGNLLDFYGIDFEKTQSSCLVG